MGDAASLVAQDGLAGGAAVTAFLLGRLVHTLGDGVQGQALALASWLALEEK